MIRRRKTPYGLYIAALVLFITVGYLISGLYTIPDLSIANVQQNFLFICTHPFQRWWNAKSPMWLEVGGICWIMFIGWYSYNNRNFQFNAEEGTEDWGDPKKVSKELAGSHKDNMRILSEHVQVSKDEDVLSNNNMICVASSGRFKTTGLV